MRSKSKATLWIRGSTYYLHWREDGKQRKISIGKISSEAAEEIRSRKEHDLLVPKRRTVPPIRFLSRAELDLLIGCGRGQSQLWRLMANTGLRFGEMLRLRWTDISTIRNRKVLRIESMEHDGSPILMPLRIIPLNENAMRALLTLRRIGNDRLVWLTGVELEACWKRTRSEAGISAGMSVLRRTFAAHLVAAGAPLQAVQVLMGHRQLSSVLKFAHLAPGYLTDTVDRLEL